MAEDLSLQTDSGEVGERFLRAAGETANLLGRTPLIGRLRPSRNPHMQSLRSLTLKRPFDHYVFYYQAIDTVVLIMRVLHSAQSASQLLSVDPE